jgi:hypothetical protein
MRIRIKRLVMVDLLSKHHRKKNNYPRFFAYLKERFFSLSYRTVPLKHTLDISINQQTTAVAYLIALIFLQIESKSKQVRTIILFFQGDLYTFIKENLLSEIFLLFLFCVFFSLKCNVL